MNALLLLLLDSRAPAGAHHHSAGMEPAVIRGWVRDLDDVEAFCRGRLRTAGRVSAAFAASACAGWTAAAPASYWALLDAEYEARTPSEAMRAASRQLGAGLRRLLAATLPDAVFDLIGRRPHHPLLLGGAVAAAGGDNVLAARAAALATCAAPASAAVRLLGLDPFGAQAILARLAPDIDEIARTAVAELSDPALLPCHSAPAIELLADVHFTEEVRLFAS